MDTWCLITCHCSYGNHYCCCQHCCAVSFWNSTWVWRSEEALPIEEEEETSRWGNEGYRVQQTLWAEDVGSGAVPSDLWMGYRPLESLKSGSRTCSWWQLWDCWNMSRSRCYCALHFHPGPRRSRSEHSPTPDVGCKKLWQTPLQCTSTIKRDTGSRDWRSPGRLDPTSRQRTEAL